MTNEAQQAASELIPKPIAEVQQVLADEVSQGREFVDIALRWLAENGISFVVNVLVALLLLAIGMVVIRVLTRTTQKALGRSGRVNALLQNFLCSVVNKTAWVLLLMIVIQRLGVNIAPLIAGLGVTGFILGFAFQESLGNLAAGMMIAINQPFQIGDYVTVGTISGTVRELNMMAATLFTADNIKVLVPNKVIWGAPITNYTATDKRRIQIAVNIAYGADISKAKRVALDVLRADPRVLDDPAPIAEVIAMGDSAVNLVLRPWTTPSDYWATFFALNQAVKEAFDREGVKIPSRRWTSASKAASRAASRPVRAEKSATLRRCVTFEGGGGEPAAAACGVDAHPRARLFERHNRTAGIEREEQRALLRRRKAHLRASCEVARGERCLAMQPVSCRQAAH